MVSGQNMGPRPNAPRTSTTTRTRTIPNFGIWACTLVGTRSCAIRRRMYKEGANTLTANFGLELLLNLKIEVTLDRVRGLEYHNLGEILALAHQRGSRIRHVVDSKRKSRVGQNRTPVPREQLPVSVKWPSRQSGAFRLCRNPAWEILARLPPVLRTHKRFASRQSSSCRPDGCSRRS